MDNQETHLHSLERRIRKLERWLRFCAGGYLLIIGWIAVSAWKWESPGRQSTAPALLRVSEIVVVDPKGLERVRIGGDLPDATVNGKRVARGEKVAGLMLYDTTGQERGGYVTFDPSGNVGLTLDTRRGQVVYFGADADVGSALQLHHSNDLIELRADDEGSRLTAVRKGRVVFQQPPAKMSPEACAAYRKARAQFTQEQVIRECNRRFRETTCNACLGKP